MVMMTMISIMYVLFYVVYFLSLYIHSMTNYLFFMFYLVLDEFGHECPDGDGDEEE